MSRKQESLFLDRVRPKLLRLPNSWWVRVQQVSTVGTPDMIGCIKSVFVGIEFKSHAKAKISAMQKYNIEKINAAGGFGLVVFPENWDNIYSTLKELASD